MNLDESNFRTYGSRPYQIILVHGGPGAIGYMAPLAKEISITAGVIEALQTKNSIEGLIEELNHIIRKQARVPVILCGHSWGAWLAMMFASRYPDHVQKLILVASAPFEDKYANGIMEVRMNRLNKEDRNRFDELIKILGSKGESVNNKIFGEIANILKKADSYDSSEDHYEHINLDYNQYQSVWQEAEQLRRSGILFNFINKIHCPVLAIHGDHDPHPAEGVSNLLEQIIPDFRFHLLEKCGHEPWTEKKAQSKFYSILKKEVYFG